MLRLSNELVHVLSRIGRTGRVGNTGRATSFFDERENAGLARPLVKVSASIGKCDFLMRLVKSWVWKHWPCQGFDWREAACAGLACWTFKRGLLLTCFSHVLRRWGCFQSKSPMVKMFRMYQSLSCITLSLTCITYSHTTCLVSPCWIKNLRPVDINMYLSVRLLRQIWLLYSSFPLHLVEILVISLINQIWPIVAALLLICWLVRFYA